MREVLEDPEATAVAIYVSAREMCGNDCVDEWEPESIRMHLEEKGINVPEENVEAIMAMRTLRTHPAALWDANVFENTVMALNDEPVDPGSIQIATPPQIAWAVEQMKHVLPPDWGFDLEPKAYAACSCVHYGLSTCPSEMAFAQEDVERMTPHQSHLRDEVKKRWAEVSDPLSHPYSEDEVGVQLALLATVTTYLEERMARLRRELGSSLED